MPIEVPLRQNIRKIRAIELRKRGFSYGDIIKSISIPKSTLSRWLQTVKLTEIQKKKLIEKRKITGVRNLNNRSLKKIQQIERIWETSLKEIGNISKRELWLMGIALYWRERDLFKNEKHLRQGIQFSSSDPMIMKFFLKWLQEAGDIKNSELNFDIFIKEKYRLNINRSIGYWSSIMNVPKIFFSQIYIQKQGLGHGRNGKHDHASEKEKGILGFPRIRVKASSTMTRQMAGWIKGINNYYSNDMDKKSFDDYV